MAQSGSSGEWTVLRTRYVPALWPIYGYFSWDRKKVLGFENSPCIQVFDKGYITVFWLSSDFQEIAETMFQKLLDNISSLDKIRQEGIATGQAALEHCKGFADKLDNAGLDDYREFLLELEKLYQVFIQKNMLYWIFSDRILEKNIDDRLTAYSEEEKKEIHAVMLLPHEVSYSQKEESEFAGLVSIAREHGVDSSEAEKAINEFSEKYFWFPYEYVGPGIWDPATVKKRVEEALNKPEEEEKAKDIAEEQAAIVEKYNLSQELQDLFSILHTTTLMQDDRKMFSTQTCYYINQVIFGRLAEKLGLTLEQARYIDAGLIEDFINDNDIDALRRRLDTRVDFCNFSQEKGKTTVYEGDAAREYLETMGIRIDIETGDLTELTGKTANPGKVRAKVRVLATSNIDNFNEGDIIVTGMTTPDFVPLLKKAGGIITNEGGITCHAAIVSRELNKPCIIGTKIATNVLKDGDEVELDADNGIIKIINKA
jgi:phosphohistidine swiveling domain-containing protein